jgi:hypothetical protein
VTARRIDVEERRARLAVRHHLAPTARTDDVVAIADDLVALHSSDPVSVYLSATARMRAPSLAAVDAALYDERTLIRHHAMRRTLWVTGHETARLTHAAATVDLHAVQLRYLRAALAGGGVADPDAWVAAGRDAVLDVLAAGPLTAREIGQRLPELTVPVPVGTGRLATTAAAHTRLLLVLGFAGDVVRARPTGTWINGQYRWAATGSWFPGGFGGADRRAAAADLARRWLAAFGPGTRADLQWWAGWTAATTTRALADAGAVEVELAAETGVVLPDDLDPGPVEPWVALLPGLDPTTMGWKRRDWYLDPEVAAAVFDRNGNAGPTAWADGRVVGGWVQRKDGTVALKLLADVGAAQRDALEAAAGELEKLVGDVRFGVRFPAPLQAELLA